MCEFWHAVLFGFFGTHWLGQGPHSSFWASAFCARAVLSCNLLRAVSHSSCCSCALVLLSLLALSCYSRCGRSRATCSLAHLVPRAPSCCSPFSSTCSAHALVLQALHVLSCHLLALHVLLCILLCALRATWLRDQAGDFTARTLRNANKGRTTQEARDKKLDSQKASNAKKQGKPTKKRKARKPRKRQQKPKKPQKPDTP